MKKNGVKYSMRPDAVSRRKGALERLERQLKSGVKPVYDADSKASYEVKLSDSDVNRIKREIETLKNRIV